MEPNELIAAWESRAVNLAYHPEHCGGATAYRTAAHELRAALAAPPVEQQAAAPDEGQLERWRSLSDALLGMDHRNMHFPTIREAAFQLQNAYIACRDLAKLPTAQPAPQAGVTERRPSAADREAWRRKATDLRGCNLSSISRHFVTDAARMLEDAYLSWAAHPTEQPSQDAARTSAIEGTIRFMRSDPDRQCKCWNGGQFTCRCDFVTNFEAAYKAKWHAIDAAQAKAKVGVA